MFFVTMRGSEASRLPLHAKNSRCYAAYRRFTRSPARRIRFSYCLSMGTRIASLMPCKNFLSAGAIVATHRVTSHDRFRRNNTGTGARGLSLPSLRLNLIPVAVLKQTALVKRCRMVGDDSNVAKACSIRFSQSACGRSLPSAMPRLPQPSGEKPLTFKRRSRSFWLNFAASRQS
jgi:hypothetical protein